MTTNTDIRGLRVPLLLAALVVIAVIVMLSETFGAMVRIWTTTQAFNHCMLIPPASLYLIWLQRKKLGYIQAEATPAVLLLVTGVVVAWVLGELANALVVQSFAAVALLILAIWAMIGTRAAYAIMFPLGYLFFMVPFGEFLIPPLMEYTADFTVAAVRISGVPIYRSGLFLQIPEGAFKVVEACSGVRMLIAALAVGALIAYLNFDLWLRRLAFIAGAAVLALAANGIRAYVVVMMAYFNGMDSVEDHNDIGYLIFGIVIVVLLLIGRWLSDEVTDDQPDVMPLPGPYAGKGVALAVVILVTLAPVSASLLSERAQAAPSASLLNMPVAVDSWSGPLMIETDWRPALVGSPFVEFGQYRSDTGRIDVYILNYFAQTQGNELISGENKLFDGRYWTNVKKRSGSLTQDSGKRLLYIEQEIRSASGAGRLARHWYVVNGQSELNPMKIKLIELGDVLRGRNTQAGMVAVSTLIEGDRTAARYQLDQFMRTVIR